jgi:hypothetical protein
VSEKALAIMPATIDGFADLSERFAKSRLLPADLVAKPADILVTLLAGQEMGLPPMASLRGIHVIKGKPVLGADTMVAVVLGSGKAVYFRRVDDGRDDAVTYETQREGHPSPQRVTWTLTDAKRAGLNGDNWTKYPRAMLAARAKAELARDVYPDVLAGCYDPDEARAFMEPEPRPAPVRHVDVVDAEVVADAPVVPDVDQALENDIAAAGTMDALKALAPRVAGLPKGSTRRASAVAALNTRKAALEAPAEVAA